MNLLDPRPGIIIFDVDGTLIDVTESYRETTPQTATRYLQLMGLEPPELTGEVYDIFKRMGGFNDDWDLTAGVLESILSKMPAVPAPCSPNSADLPELIHALQQAAEPLRRTPITPPDWPALIEPVREAGGGLIGLRRLTGGRNAHLIYNFGDPATTDIVQRLFSEIYLGDALFKQGYGFPAHFVIAPGMIERERLLIRRATLDALADNFRLGIATGRTRFEAAQAIRLHELHSLFPVITTMTDALEAQAEHNITGHNALLKPHPFLLHQAADALDAATPGRPPLPAVYVGDSPDDIVAAQRADGLRSWQAVGLSPADSALRDLQLSLGAHHALEHPDQLMQLL